MTASWPPSRGRHRPRRRSAITSSSSRSLAVRLLRCLWVTNAGVCHPHGLAVVVDAVPDPPAGSDLVLPLLHLDAVDGTFAQRAPETMLPRVRVPRLARDSLPSGAGVGRSRRADLLPPLHSVIGCESEVPAALGRWWAQERSRTVVRLLGCFRVTDAGISHPHGSPVIVDAVPDPPAGGHLELPLLHLDSVDGTVPEGTPETMLPRVDSSRLGGDSFPRHPQRWPLRRSRFVPIPSRRRWLRTGSPIRPSTAAAPPVPCASPFTNPESTLRHHRHRSSDGDAEPGSGLRGSRLLPSTRGVADQQVNSCRDRQPPSTSSSTRRRKQPDRPSEATSPTETRRQPSAPVRLDCASSCCAAVEPVPRTPRTVRHLDRLRSVSATVHFDDVATRRDRRARRRHRSADEGIQRTVARSLACRHDI